MLMEADLPNDVEALSALVLDPLPDAFLALSLNRAPELVDRAADVIVTGKQLAQTPEVVGRN